MENISQEAKNLLKAIELYGPIRSSELAKKLNISIKTVYKHLAALADEQLITKTGMTPQVYYAIKSSRIDVLAGAGQEDQFIEQDYIYVSPSGEMTRGIEGFQLWCQKNKFDFAKEKKMLTQKIVATQKLKKDGLISAKKTILSGKKELYLDNIFFSDFYNLDHFGKTKLGQLVYLGKSSQNKELIREVAKTIKPAIKGLIEKYDIKLICYIPPTIDRKTQFLEVLKKGLQLNLPEITAIKIASATKVPQKTLRKLEDRIINAQTTIAVNPNQKIAGNVLIIDDATGSGATLNETANKIRKIVKGNIKIIGYSVVGSFKGFDVISEV
ncbi:MAG: helix-turn-helix domain-containing protein [Candidatus Moranbacteria bacterium]|nr:helix-turn-helix domain-containing protein [Candidatus Moranbacteria bacterium]